MKKIISILFIFLFITNCDSVDPDNSRISKLIVTDINIVEINNLSVSIDITVQTPTPCWQYERTEKNQNENSAHLTIIGKDESEACITVLSSFERVEKLNFSTHGVKTVKFWATDSTSLDTTITL